MPLYMDRHDVTAEGLTPERIAELHSCDLQVQDKYGVKMLTYWWHQGASAGFCLIESPSKEAAEATHREGHGKVPSRIIEVDWQSVEGFLGPVRGPSPGEPWEDIAAKTIMCVSIADSSAGSPGVAFAHKTLSARGGRAISPHQDRIVGCFPSVLAGLECSLALRKSLTSVGFFQQGTETDVRIGISSGEPVARRMGLFGPAVAEAEALCAMAEPGDVLVSRSVRELCGNRGFLFSEERSRQVSDFEEPLRHHHLCGRTETPAHAIEPFFVPSNGQSGRRSFPSGLSAREVEVLRLIAAGRTNQEIAESLFISLSTVASHVRHIFDKANVANRAEATSFAYRHRLA